MTLLGKPAGVSNIDWNIFTGYYKGRRIQMRNGKGQAHIHWSDELKRDSERQGANTGYVYASEMGGNKCQGNQISFLNSSIETGKITQYKRQDVSSQHKTQLEVTG